MDEEFNLVLVGHVDHGKSTFIGRLLYDSGSLKPDKIEEVKSISKSLGKEMDFAYFTDNLEEEREEEKTIDIFKTKFKSEKSYNLIDCPGHKEFVKNMLTGASRGEAALLMLSAKAGEGMQDQTKRHLFLIKMLGINTLFVAINKMDTVGYNQDRFEEIKKDLDKFLGKIDFHPVAIVPISAKKGDNILKKSENIGWYSGEPIIKIIDKVVEKRSGPNFLRAVVQGKYGDIILIKIESGTIKKGQEVFFNYAESRDVVESILSGLDEKQESKAGDVVGIKIRQKNALEEISRGEILSSLENKPEKLSEVKAEIFALEGINQDQDYVFKSISGERKAKIKEIQKIGIVNEDLNLKELLHAEAANVEISLDKDVVIEKFSKFEPLGRFLLLDDKNKKIVAIGILN